jgi:membrane-associated protein
MQVQIGFGNKNWQRWLIWSCLGVFLLGTLAGSIFAQGEGGQIEAVEVEAKPSWWVQVLQNIFNTRELMRILGQPEYRMAAFLVLNLIVFVETGLLIGFFLPGDSLLVTAGIVCFASGWSLPLLLVTLSLSAIIGDSLGYSIGYKTGPKIFNREKSFFFNRDHLIVAQAFYERHGGKTIILARFMPIIRTFAPVVAGVGKMNYKRFLFYNIFGGIGWVFSMILLGYFLTQAIDPLFQRLLGNDQFTVHDHIEKVIIIVVLLSISPGIFFWLKNKLKGKPDAEPEMVGTGK